MAKASLTAFMASLALASLATFSSLATGFKLHEHAAQGNRPQFHFTPLTNWMNDPNGLTFYNGEYHLFFQHNPFDVVWGHMTWGHAVSKDLIHWTHLENAITPDSNGDIWSGSAIADTQNSSGLQLPGKPAPLIAFYTSHSSVHDQRLAYSSDYGRTWSKMSEPIIPSASLDQADHQARDPKVEWHVSSKKWVMTLYLHRVQLAGKWETKFGIFTSSDLKHWTHAQDISMDDDYECPDMFELPVQGSPSGERKFVLLSGGGTYLVGDFDGRHFKASGPSQHVEYGDAYAAQTFSGEPKARRIQLSWLGHPSSATCNNPYQNEVFTGQMSVPMELQLVSAASVTAGSASQPILRRAPSSEIDALKHVSLLNLEDHKMAANSSISAYQQNDGAGLDVFLQLSLQDGISQTLSLNILGQELTLDIFAATESRDVPVGLVMKHSHRTPCRGLLKTRQNHALPILIDKAGLVTIRAIADRLSLEVFDISGGASMALCRPADRQHKKIELEELSAQELQIHKLRVSAITPE